MREDRAPTTAAVNTSYRPAGPAARAAQRPRVAWLGQRSARAGNGLVTYSRELTEGLRQRGVEVLFFHHDPEAGDGVEMQALALSRGFRIARRGSRSRLVEALRRGRVDIVHVSLSFSSLDFELTALCHGLGLPVVATIHVPFDGRSSTWGALSRFLYRIYSVPLARFDQVIVFGPAQLELLAGMGVPRAALRIIPNGVDVDRFSPGPSDWRERLGCDRLFVYLGRLDPEKNVGTLIDAFLASGPPPGLRLAVAGSGSEWRHLRRLYGDPRVAFLGLITEEADRVGLLRAAEAFFLPSSIEGLSLALLEAMACGACPIATTVGCDGDAIDGVGIPLDPGSLSSDLRLAIGLLTRSPEIARLLGGLARQRVVERYSLDRSIDLLIEDYGQLIAESAGLRP